MDDYKQYYLLFTSSSFGCDVDDCTGGNELCEGCETYGDNLPLSRLEIDDDYNIRLPQFGNVQIDLQPLPKALYILILRHPEGIRLKYISDYKDEMEYIYRSVSSRQNPTVIRRMLDDITNPLSDGLNKNLSKIRAAFQKSIARETAEYYIPTRSRGQEKLVLLDSSLISFPYSLVNPVKH